MTRVPIVPMTFLVVCSMVCGARGAAAGSSSHEPPHGAPAYVYDRSASPGASTVEVAPGASGLTAATWQRADAADAERVSGWIEGLASGWAPNLGQLADDRGRPLPDVLYSVDAGAARVLVTTSGLSHYFFARGREDEAHAGPEREGAAPPTSWCRVDVALEGASIVAASARAGDPVADAGTSNFYLAHRPDGVVGVPAYGTVTFPEVYPGIDWVLRSSPAAGVHHDFVVHPGADPSRIRFRYRGARAIETTEGGSALVVRTSLGEVREGALRCTQDDGRVVGARFRVRGDLVTVTLDDYDHGATLTIDPPMLWSTYYGGSNYDGPRSIWCDNANGDFYVVGYTASTNLPGMNPGGGAYYTGTLNGVQDGFVWKFSQLGVRRWATYYGGSSIEVNTDCVADASGNLYVSGITYSTDFPTQTLAGAYNQTIPGGGTSDGYLIKFSALGVRQWATYYGGSGNEQATGVTVSAAGQVYMCGFTSSLDLPLVNPGGGAYFQAAGDTLEDAFVTRFSSTGALQWATYFGGRKGQDEANGITTFGNSLYVTGSTQSPFFPTLNPGGGAYFQPSPSGDQDAFIARFTLAGAQTWATYFGADSTDYGDEPAVDANGNLFVYGYTVSTNLPIWNPGGGAYVQSTLGGVYDFFIVKFDASNAPVWSTYYGGSDSEFINGAYGKPITIDSQGRVYITGMTFSNDLPVLNPGGGSYYQGAFGGAIDVVLAQFANNGQMLWSSYYGSTNADFGTGVGIGVGGCLFATGESVQLSSFPTMNPGLGAWYQSTNAGSDDGFLAKFCSKGSACCLDFNCIAVTSQAECTALGGTAFYPNQTCASTNCNVLCTICGVKFQDLNRNGVQDGGEPGLANWSIQLQYPNGSVYATITTDATGHYCFNNIPCGAWTVNEVMQPGWVQTAPSPGTHQLNLGTGSTQNGVSFGNAACASAPPCVGPPPHLVAWWPFADAAGATAVADVTHLDPARNAAQLHLGAAGTSQPDVICFASPADDAVVPNTSQVGLGFGDGPFAIAAWISPSSAGAGRRPIVEKRVLVSASTHQTRGWALYLDGLQSRLEVGAGGAAQVVPGPNLSADTWSHLAVSIDRAKNLGRWYLNGAAVTAYDFAPLPGVVSCTADLHLGQSGAAFGTTPGFQGCIADLALFSAPLDAATAGKAWSTGPTGWCPEYAVVPQVTTICKDLTTVQVCFNLCNNQATPQSYHWSLAGLPAGPGCSFAGPTLFSPAAGAVTVPAGGCSAPICVTITRPLGFTAQNATSCYQLSFVNDATGACRRANGTVRADNSCWCVTPLSAGLVSVPARVAAGATIGIGIGHPCDPPATLSYRLSAAWLDDGTPDPLAVSLNGLPPGTPVTGEVSSGSGDGTRAGLASDPQVSVAVSYPNGYDPAARYEIVLEADMDGDGTLERVCGTPVASNADSASTVAVTESWTPDAVRLAANPNPFLLATTIGFDLPHPDVVDLAVYDLGGRVVRTLLHGRLDAGHHEYAWTGRDDAGRRTPAGIYFVRFQGAGRTLETKLIRVP